MSKFFRRKTLVMFLCLLFLMPVLPASGFDVYWKDSLTSLQAVAGVRPGDKAVVFTNAGAVSFYYWGSNTWNAASNYMVTDATLAAIAALTITQGSIVYGTGTDAFSVLAKGTAGQLLRMNAGATAPAWSTVSFPDTAAAGDVLYASATNTWTSLAKGTAYQTLQMNSGATAPQWASGETWLSTTNLPLNADGNTTIFTVPAGRTAILTKAVLIIGADAGSTDFTIGQAGALDDFLGTQQTDNLNAANDVGIFEPVPAAVAALRKAYAAGTVIKAAVANQAGGATNSLRLYGIIY